DEPAAPRCHGARAAQLVAAAALLVRVLLSGPAAPRSGIAGTELSRHRRSLPPDGGRQVALPGRRAARLPRSRRPARRADRNAELLPRPDARQRHTPARARLPPDRDADAAALGRRGSGARQGHDLRDPTVRSQSHPALSACRLALDPAGGTGDGQRDAGSLAERSARADGRRLQTPRHKDRESGAGLLGVFVPWCLKFASTKVAELDGKTCLITGASSGIGRATALALAGMGAQLVLVCRDRGRGENVLAEIAQQTGKTEATLLLGDLAVQCDIRRVAAEFLAIDRPLHVLINNAGVVNLHRSVTADGIESTFAVNHLAYFLL